MMNLRRITKADDGALAQLIAVYEESFPVEERRDIPHLRYLIENRESMYFNAIECDGGVAGLFVYWKLDGFYYLEHLAVYAEMRNKKIGQQVLDFVRDNLHGLRILEVEHAEDEITTRRVNYYQRNGYKILDRSYIQPSYDGVHNEIALWIMGSEEGVAPELLNKYINITKEEVYFKNRNLL